MSRPSHAPVESVGGLDRMETVVYSLLFAGVVLAFSTALQIQFTLPKLVIVRAATAALLILWAWRFHRGEIRRLPRPVLVTAVSLTVWWVITTATAADPPTALEGAHGRFNGLWTNLMLLTLFGVAATSPAPLRHRTLRIRVLVMCLVVAAFYTIVQRAGWDVFVWPFSRPASTIGHPVTLATALGLGAPFALVFALTAGRGFARLVWGLVFVILAVAIGFTLSRGPLLAMMASSAIAIFAIARPRLVSRKAIWTAAMLVFLTLLVSGLSIVRLRSGRFLPSVEQLTREPEIQNRLHTLSAAAGIARDHPVLGVGLENYHVLYPRYRPAEAEQLTPDSVPTMVHSGYFQAAVTTGVVGLALYLGFIAAALGAQFQAYRTTSGANRTLLAGSIASVTGYLVADLTGWPEMSTLSLFYLLLGIGLSAAPADQTARPRSRGMRTAVLAAAGAWVVVIVFLTGSAVQMLRADFALRSARMFAVAGDWPQAQASIAGGLQLGGTRAAHQDAAASLFAERFGATGDRALYDAAAQLFESAHARAPYNEYFMIHRIDLETASLQKNKGGAPSSGANQIAATLLAHDLHNGTVYEALARMRLAEGTAAPALDMITRALALRPQHGGYRRLEGDIRRALGDRATAVAAYRRALSVMPPGTPAWVGVKHRLIATLIESGDYTTAIDEAKGTLAIAPGDALTRRLLDAATEARRARATGS